MLHRDIIFESPKVPSAWRVTVFGALALILGAAGAASCSKDQVAAPKVIVLGLDGMDPRLTERLMDAGELPHLDHMRRHGGFKPLGTTMPPQSPVAWASFITGANPGVHGIFDFIHRDPAKQCLPYYSAAETVEGEGAWDVGAYQIPLTFWPFNHAPTQTLLKRDGTPFWDYLDQAGIATCFYDIPANYPPSPSAHGHMHCLSGMGVPDLQGTYGTYQYFSELVIRRKDEGGGIRKPLTFRNHKAKAQLDGPYNTALKVPKASTIEFSIYRHPTAPSARIDLEDQTVVLKEGEWSDWVQLRFPLDMPSFLPDGAAPGICRFYLKETHPNLSLYVTPINIDPSDPGDQRITEPPEMITDIAKELGLFYTAGFQEDHKALSHGVFSDEEFKAQAAYVLDERVNLLDYARRHYKDGLLFFYFSSTDLQAHMFWWDSEDQHPLRSATDAKKYNQAVIDLYKRMDTVVGELVEAYGDEATILVMSDHGFCNFRRQVNVNTWLRDHGYLDPPDARSLLNPMLGQMVDWTRTRAYGLGLNGLYLNLAGRERDGVVRPDQRDALLDEISRGLLELRDPANGNPVVKNVHRSDEIYSGPHTVNAPDLLIGFHRGYRASWATTMGDMSKDVVTDNDSAWSADHCIDASEVPGVIFANKPLRRMNPSLIDLAPTILTQFGVDVPAHMVGGDLFKSEVTARDAQDQE